MQLFSHDWCQHSSRNTGDRNDLLAKSKFKTLTGDLGRQGSTPEGNNNSEKEHFKIQHSAKSLIRQVRQTERGFGTGSQETGYKYRDYRATTQRKQGSGKFVTYLKVTICLWWTSDVDAAAKQLQIQQGSTKDLYNQQSFKVDTQDQCHQVSISPNVK